MNIGNFTTPSNGSLGSRIDEERSEMRNVFATCKSREASNFLTQCTYDENFLSRYAPLSIVNSNLCDILVDNFVHTTASKFNVHVLLVKTTYVCLISLSVWHSFINRNITWLHLIGSHVNFIVAIFLIVLNKFWVYFSFTERWFIGYFLFWKWSVN